MRKMVEAVLERYGTRMLVTHGDTTEPVKAFFQPDKSEADAVTPLGIAQRSRYLYIGPADRTLETGDSIIVDGTGYRVVQTEAFSSGSGPVYRRAICVRKGGADEWASQT